MRYVTLEAAVDEYDSKPGFVIAGSPEYDGKMADRGADISLIAHDIVEHQNGLRAIGPIWDELEAMGGIWHARGRWGDLGAGSRFSPAESVAGDLVRMARDLSFMSWRDQEAMGFRPPNTREHECDDDFGEILAIARDQIPGELDDQILDVDKYLDESLHRMRIGYRKANRRFGDRFQSNNQFRAISDEIKRAVRWIDFEGQRFRLAWGAGKCSINPIYEEEEY